MSDFKALDPQSLAIRPLSKGMITNVPTQLIPSGGGLNVFNFDVETIGLRTCSQWKPLSNPPDYGTIPLVSGEYVTDMIPFYVTGGGRQLLALTNMRLMKSTDGLDWTAVQKNTGGVYTTFNWTISKPFIVQWCSSQYYAYFVDGSTTTGIMVYDGYYLTKNDPVDADNNVVFNGATTIALVSNRLVVGGTGEAGGAYRMRWSSITDHFSFDVLDYADLTDTHGVIQRITSYEEYPIIFVDDGVYFGQPYGYDATLTAAWIIRPLESGGNSIIGPRAFVRVTGGICFAGRDDFFYINALKQTEKGDFTIESMKCPILRETLRNPSIQPAITNTILLYDSHHKRVIMGMSNNTAVQGVSIFAAYHLDTEVWSMFSTPLGIITAMQDISTALSTRWSDYPAGIADPVSWADYIATKNGSWYSELSGFSAAKIIAIGPDGIPYVLLRELGISRLAGATALLPQTLNAVFETGDLDFDIPDANKIAFKIAARIGSTEYVRTTTIRLVIEGSANKGRTWKVLGAVNIAPNEDEEEIHFRLFGTNLRFRVTFTSNDPDVTPFLLEELTLRLRGGAQQTVRNAVQED